MRQIKTATWSNGMSVFYQIAYHFPPFVFIMRLLFYGTESGTFSAAYGKYNSAQGEPRVLYCNTVLYIPAQCGVRITKA